LCHKLDPRFFAELAAMDPEETRQRAICDYDPKSGTYRIDAWGGTYLVRTEECEILPADQNTPPANLESGLSIIFYLLRVKGAPIRGEWISEKDLPGGPTFFRGPHAVPVQLITERYGDDVDGFHRACQGMGGTPADMADASYVFRVLPRLPVAALLWAADDEFGAEARLLFDRSITRGLPLDIIFGVAVELCHRIAARA